MGYNPIQNGGEAETNLTAGLKRNVIIAYIRPHPLVQYDCG